MDKRKSSTCTSPSRPNYRRGSPRNVKPRNAKSSLSVAHIAKEDNINFVIDSAATDHIINDKELFSKGTFKRTKGRKLSGCVPHKEIDVIGSGEVVLFINNVKIVLKHVLFVPSVTQNLISGSKLDQDGFSFCCEQRKIIVTKNAQYCYTAFLRDGLYIVKMYKSPKNVSISKYKSISYVHKTEPKSSSIVSVQTTKKSKNVPNVNKVNQIVSSVLPVSKSLNVKSDNKLLEEWHRKLAHINVDYIKNTSKLQAVKGLPELKGTLRSCTACREAKSRRVSFKPSTEVYSNKPLNRLFLDLCGPFPVESVDGNRYFLSILDQYSKKAWVYPIKRKSDTFNVFVVFVNNAERYTDCKLKHVRSDNGTEFDNNDFKAFFEKLGVTHEKTNPYTPEESGLVERFHYTGVNGIKVLLRDSGMSQGFWAEALKHFTHTWNRVVHSGSKTPCELYSGVKPNVTYLKVFGSRVFYGIPRQLRSKLDMRAKEGILTGYAQQTKGYRIWIPSEHRFIETINVRVDESDTQRPVQHDVYNFDSVFPSHEQYILLNPNYDSVNVVNKTPVIDIETQKVLHEDPTDSDSSSDDDQQTDDPQVSDVVVQDADIDKPPPKSINWIRYPKRRKKGPRIDIYYYPEGRDVRLRSLKDIKTYCKAENLIFEECLFDFSSANRFQGVVSSQPVIDRVEEQIVMSDSGDESTSHISRA